MLLDKKGTDAREKQGETSRTDWLMLDWPDFRGGHCPAELRPQTVAGLLERRWVGRSQVYPRLGMSPGTSAWELVCPLWFTSEGRALGLTCLFVCVHRTLIRTRARMEAQPQLGPRVAFADVTWHPKPPSLSCSYFDAVSFT